MAGEPRPLRERGLGGHGLLRRRQGLVAACPPARRRRGHRFPFVHAIEHGCSNARAANVPLVCSEHEHGIQHAVALAFSRAQEPVRSR